MKNNSIGSDIENSMSDSDVSVSDLDCSGLVNDLEKASSPVTVNNVAGSSQTASNHNSDNSDPNMQQLINARILEQLDKIGQRLDRIENNECKKTSDKSKIKNSASKVVKQKKTSPKIHQPSHKAYLPTPDQHSSVADETLLQLKVDQRLQELSDLAKSGTFPKIKTQRGGPVHTLPWSRK